MEEVILVNTKQEQRQVSMENGKTLYKGMHTIKINFLF